MASTKTKYSISEAARITQKSRTTISAHIKARKISLELDANGNKLIDASELIRVYGDDCDFDRAAPASKSTPNNKVNQSAIGQAGTLSELHTVQQLLTAQTEERDREREQLQARIDHLEKALQQSQEGHNRATMLLQDHSKHEKIRNQARHYKLALAQERNKTLWQKLFS